MSSVKTESDSSQALAKTAASGDQAQALFEGPRGSGV